MSHACAKDQGPERPRSTILLVIDGLSYKAPERLELPTLERLMDQGSYFKECYFLPTAHPRKWLHTCSLGNAATVTGTIFFRQGQEQLQRMFAGRGVRAHAAGGSGAYLSISVDYDFVNIGSYNDDQVMNNALVFVRNPDLVFLRIHLQDLGGAGSRVRGRLPSIWMEGSEYPEVARHADELVAKLVGELRRTERWSDTLLVVAADHGQADTGWHPPFVEESWRAPLILTGPGVKKGQTFPYAEIIDLAPTICHLMDVPAPADSIGVVLNESLVRPEEKLEERRATLRDLDQIMKKYVDIREQLDTELERLKGRPERKK